MTKIMIDEAAVRLALESLEYWRTSPETCGFTYKAQDAATALHQALADAALDKMAENERELGIQMQPDCDHDWKYIGSKRQSMWECTKCGMYKVPDEQPRSEAALAPAQKD